MSAQSLSILANMPPPSYEVQIPVGQEQWHQLAAPLFLTLAVVFFGWWIARSRTFRKGSDRALLLACAGCAWLSYTSWWIWTNRNSFIARRDIAAILAVEMPTLWIQFCMLAFLICRVHLHNVKRLEAEERKLDPKNSHWRNEVLACLLALATMIPLVLAGHHALFLGFMFFCWVLAFAAWGAIGLVSWLCGRLFEWRKTSRTESTST